MTPIIQSIADEPQGFCLAGLLLLSLVLPLMASGAGGGNNPSAKPWIRTVWTGQILLGLAGLVTVVFPQHSVMALALELVLCAMLAGQLHRQIRRKM